MCEELTKVLLHLSDQIEESKQAAKKAIVSLLCNCPVKVITWCHVILKVKSSVGVKLLDWSVLFH